MATLTTPCPYGVLGVSRDATATEIRSAYRKLVLKCHPDKIQDESKRSQGQDEFQKVQEAYELLSDESKRAKHDMKVQMAAEARRAGGSPDTAGSSPSGSAPASSSPSPSFFKTTREYRGGKVYEEKTYVRRYDDEEPRYPEEPTSRPSSSRKYDGHDRKHTSAKDPEEKKKPKSSESSSKSTKERLRENLRSTRKTKDKERRREQSEKQSRFAYNASDEDDTASGLDKEYAKSPKHKSSHERKEDIPFSTPQWVSPKYIVVEDTAFEYIQRSRASVLPEPERRGSYPMSAPIYHDTLGTMSGDTARRSSARPVRSGRSGPDLRSTYEIVDTTVRGRTTPRKSATPTSSSANIRVATGSKSAASPRSSTMYEVKGTKSSAAIPTLRRAETAPSSGQRTEMLFPMRSSRARDRHDSGYSSPGTPDLHSSSPPKSSKFTIIDEDDEYGRAGHRTVISNEAYRRHQSVSPSRRVIPLTTLRATSRPAQTRTRPNVRAEPSRVMPTRNSPPLRHASERLFAEVERPDADYIQRFPTEQIRYSPKFRPEDVRYAQGESYHPGAIRRESYAY